VAIIHLHGCQPVALGLATQVILMIHITHVKDLILFHYHHRLYHQSGNLICSISDDNKPGLIQPQRPHLYRLYQGISRESNDSFALPFTFPTTSLSSS
jgi:hypothetical protein